MTDPNATTGTTSNDVVLGQEIPHCFETKSYSNLTYCDICNGLLAGLWSQGLQCKICHLNVHRGEGQGGHDDCYGEALLQPCPLHVHKKNGNHDRQSASTILVESNTTSTDARPSTVMEIIQEASQQLDRDLKAHAKQVVVATGVEDERTRKLKRLKEKFATWRKSLEAIEARGEIQVTLLLLLAKLVLTIVFAAATYLLVLLAMLPLEIYWMEEETTNGISSWAPSPRLYQFAWLHACTILGYEQATLWILSVLVQRWSRLFHRKVHLIRHFLKQALDLNLKEDVGVSVDELDSLFQIWSGRFFRSATLSSVVILILWWQLHQVSLLDWYGCYG